VGEQSIPSRMQFPVGAGRAHSSGELSDGTLTVSKYGRHLSGQEEGLTLPGECWILIIPSQPEDTVGAFHRKNSKEICSINWDCQSIR